MGRSHKDVIKRALEAPKSDEDDAAEWQRLIAERRARDEQSEPADHTDEGA